MPSFNVSPGHCLYLDKSELSEGERFQEQCRIILGWEKKGLTPTQLFGLSDPLNWKSIKKAKMQLYLHFHPDKNKDQPLLATDAIKILNDAFDYLRYSQSCIPEQDKLNYDDVASNAFVRDDSKGESSSKRSDHSAEVQKNAQMNKRHILFD